MEMFFEQSKGILHTHPQKGREKQTKQAPKQTSNQTPQDFNEMYNIIPI